MLVLVLVFPSLLFEFVDVQLRVVRIISNDNDRAATADAATPRTKVTLLCCNGMVMYCNKDCVWNEQDQIKDMYKYSLSHTHVNCISRLHQLFIMNSLFNKNE